MAIGLHKSELTGHSTRRANSRELEPTLPRHGATVSLSYSGKLSKEEVLRPDQPAFLQLHSDRIEAATAISRNSFTWTDNWHGLHKLLQQGTKAQLVYIDPPYATGRGFASRSHEHAYSDSLTDALYVEYMRRRIILMREILDESGSIYVHIGHQMLGEMKMILDEVFGPENFLNLITRRKCSSKNFTKNQYSNLNDYILYYSKGKNYIWNRPSKTPSPEWVAREYPKTDERGQFKLVPIHAPGIRHGATGTAWRGMLPPPGKHWQFVPGKLDELDSKGEIHWSKNGNPRRKVYLTPDKDVGYTDYWDEFKDAHHQAALVSGYPTEKNFAMMQLIVSASSNPGDLVLDPFCGSGSTMHAAGLLGRDWIGMDESFVAAKTTIQRLTQGRCPMGDFVNVKEAFPQKALPLGLGYEETVRALNFFVDEATANTATEEMLAIQAMLPKAPVTNSQ